MIYKLSMRLLVSALSAALLLPASRTFAATTVVGNGTPASCTEAALDAALAIGGAVQFNCGDDPNTITITQVKAINTLVQLDGGGKITLSGGNTSGLFSIKQTGALELSNLTLRDANNGQAIYNLGTLTVTNVAMLNNARKAIFSQLDTARTVIRNSRFENNQATATAAAVGNESGATTLIADSIFINNSVPNSQYGGAVYNGADLPDGPKTTVLINNSFFRDNSAGVGGAIISYGTITIANSTIISNTAIDGGGIVFGNGSMDVLNSTLAYNRAELRGGGFAANTNLDTTVQATLVNVTMVGNQADQGANLKLYNKGKIELKNTVIADGACSVETTATLVDGGNNRQSPGASCGATIPEVADFQLGVLQDNGGLTPTFLLAASSPLREAGNNAACPAFDQRGILRPRGALCDIGAVEYDAIPSINAINPVAAPSFGPPVTIVISGTNVIQGNKHTFARWMETPLATQYISPTQLQATIPSSLLTTGGVYTITLETPVEDGGVSLESVTFLVLDKKNYLPLVTK